MPTGAGGVFNTAQPRPGQSVVVFGVGGIGSCAVAAAAVAGCTPVIAVDVNPDKLALAHKLGATHAINSKSSDAVAEILKLCKGGADYAIEATGIARSFGKIANGSLSVTMTVESFGVATPSMDVALPSANSLAPLIG